MLINSFKLFKCEDRIYLTVFLLPCCNQEDPSKLSDQQEAVKWAQNPYPIYAAVNVRPNISSGDFAGMNMAALFWLAEVHKFSSPVLLQS